MIFRVPKSYPNILLFAVQNKIKNTTLVCPAPGGVAFAFRPTKGRAGNAKSWVCSRLRLRTPRPSVHQFAPPRERVRSTVGLFGLIADDMSRACSASSRGCAFRCPPNLGMTIGSRARCRLNFERRAGKRAAGPSAGEKIVAGPPGFSFPRGTRCSRAARRA
jgi:hypothetical protein